MRIDWIGIILGLVAITFGGCLGIYGIQHDDWVAAGVGGLLAAVGIAGLSDSVKILP